MEKFPSACEPLRFFVQVADFQAEAVPEPVAWNQLPALFPQVVDLLQRVGTGAMRQAAGCLAAERFPALLADCWSGRIREGLEILPARILLQPFAYRYSPGSASPAPPAPAGSAHNCPCCFHAPQAGLLKTVGHGRALALSCSLCLREWDVPRNVCTFCGKQGHETLEYYSAEQFPGRMLQSCRSCRCYLHLVDLEVHPRAAADADEIAGVVLDLWAREQGLNKRQQNLAGC